MGAHSFHDSAYGANAGEAFREACDAALYEFGHNPYNGTISTVHGFVDVPILEGEDVNDWAHRVLDDPRVQKWEACACCEDPNGKEENGRKLYHFAGWAAS